MTGAAAHADLLSTNGAGSRIYKFLLRQCFGAFAENVFRTLAPSEGFQPNWHIDLICDRLEQVRRGEIRRE